MVSKQKTPTLPTFEQTLAEAQRQANRTGLRMAVYQDSGVWSWGTEDWYRDGGFGDGGIFVEPSV